SRPGVCSLKGWISNAGTNTVAKASKITATRSTQRSQRRPISPVDRSLRTDSPLSEVRIQRSEVRGQRSEIPCQKPEVRSQATNFDKRCNSRYRIENLTSD